MPCYRRPVTEIKCHACGVPVHRGSAFEHDGHMYHVPCLVRSLQGEIEVLRGLYEALRPHVSDRSVLRGLCGLADVAEHEGHAKHEDARNALDWLRQAAGWKSEGESFTDLPELPRWTRFISPDLVTLASECNHDRGDEDQAPSLPISTDPSRRSTL